MIRFSKKRALFWVAVAAGFLLAILALCPPSVLTVRLPRRDSKAVVAVRVVEGAPVALSYRHSVELTEVEGRFRVAPGPCLRISETRFTSVGTGLPNTAVERTRREDGWYVVDEGLRKIEELRFFLSPVNRTRLTVGNRICSFESLEPGSLLMIKVERMGWLEWYRSRQTLDTAAKAGASHRPFVFAVALAASCSLLTPIGYQTNLLVYGPGGYRLRDYLRLGGPLAILLWIVAVFLLPVVFPF